MSRRRVLVLGAGGRLGGALARCWRDRHDVQTAGRAEADLRDGQALARLVRMIRPDVAVNCAALTNVDACEERREEAAAVNADAPGVLAEICAREGVRLLHVSTDYVFGGEASEPYAEDAAPAPVSWYGETKRRGEEAVREAAAFHAVARVSWVFGPERESFADAILRQAVEGRPLRAVADKWSSPTFADDAAAALEALFGREAEGGIYHVCNAGVCSWHEWAEGMLAAAGDLGADLRSRRIEPLRLAEMASFKARRPVYTPLRCGRIEALRGRPMRPWREALADYARMLVAAGRLPVTSRRPARG